MTSAVEDEDSIPQLSAETLKALQEFLEEQTLHQEENNIPENWQLSQFWYDENTTSILTSAVLENCKNEHNIALISCPTLYPTIKTKIEESKKDIKLKLFEYDKRFSKYPDFVLYDYNEPLNISCEYKNFFDLIAVDPPFLSEECLTKTVTTVNLIRKETSKIILCTGAVMETLGAMLLNLKKCSFKPKHKNNLRNEFICMTNFGEISQKLS